MILFEKITPRSLIVFNDNSLHDFGDSLVEIFFINDSLVSCQQPEHFDGLLAVFLLEKPTWCYGKSAQLEVEGGSA